MICQYVCLVSSRKFANLKAEGPISPMPNLEGRETDVQQNASPANVHGLSLGISTYYHDSFVNFALSCMPNQYMSSRRNVTRFACKNPSDSLKRYSHPIRTIREFISQFMHYSLHRVHVQHSSQLVSAVR